MTHPISSQPSHLPEPPSLPLLSHRPLGRGQRSRLKNSGPLNPTCPFDPGLCDAPMETMGWVGPPPLWPPGGRRSTPGGQITATFYMQSLHSRAEI